MMFLGSIPRMASFMASSGLVCIRVRYLTSFRPPTQPELDAFQQVPAVFHIRIIVCQVFYLLLKTLQLCFKPQKVSINARSQIGRAHV